MDGEVLKLISAGRSKSSRGMSGTFTWKPTADGFDWEVKITDPFYVTVKGEIVGAVEMPASIREAWADVARTNDKLRSFRPADETDPDEGAA